MDRNLLYLKLQKDLTLLKTKYTYLSSDKEKLVLIDKILKKLDSLYFDEKSIACVEDEVLELKENS